MTNFSYPEAWVDVHAHVFSADPSILELLGRVGVRMNNICVAAGDDAELARQHELAARLARLPDSPFSWTTGWPSAGYEEPGYPEGARTMLRAARRDGAVATKVWKDIGLKAQRSNGDWVQIDDPEFQPLIDELIARSMPLIAHLADPLVAWGAIEPGHPDYPYYALHPEWYFVDRPDVPRHEVILAARERMLERNPDLSIVACHLASLDHDLVRLAAFLDEHPNVAIDTAERVGQMMLLDRDEVRAFFIRYQDRIIYGSDLIFNLLDDDGTDPAAFLERAESVWQSELTWLQSDRVVETRDGTGRGLGLPDAVLDQVLLSNATRWLPGIMDAPAALKEPGER